MVKWPKILGLAVLSCGTPMTSLALEVRAATSATPDIPPSAQAGEGGTVDRGSLKSGAGPNREEGKPVLIGNPLWTVPLSVLTATRERPIFSASRRPRVVVTPQVEQSRAAVPPKAAEPERSRLSLIGAIVGDGVAIAIFLDRTNQKIVRLRQGEAHAGWELSSVLGREATLKKAGRTEVLALPRPDGAANAAGATGVSGGLVVPAAGGFDASYAPYVPRSTPKNGESDGL
jgi:general secretion pathway protein N